MKYTEEHLWLRYEPGEDDVSVGITALAAEALGQAQFVELPEEGDTISVDDPVVVIEGADDAVDILAPLDGEVVEVNTRLIDSPATITDDPQGDAWLFKMSLADPDAYEELMDEAAYLKFIR